MADLDDLLRSEPDQVSTLGDHLSQIAAQISEQNATLRAVNSADFWEGIAAAEFEHVKADLPPLLETVATRYSSASTALKQYAPPLQDAKEKARQALNDREIAEQDLQRAEQGVQDMQDHDRSQQRIAEQRADQDPSAPAYQAQPYPGPNWYSMRDDAQQRRDDAQRRLDEAVRQYKDASDTCSGVIREAADDGIRNEGGIGGFFGGIGDFFGGIGDFFSAAWDVITDVAETVVDAINAALPAIAQVLTVLSAIVGIASIFFPVLAPLALGLAIASLAADTILAVQGRGSWTDVALGVVGVATFGLGTAFGASARGARAAAGARAVASSADDAARVARAGLAAERGSLNAVRQARGALRARQSLQGLTAPGRNVPVVYGNAARNVHIGQMNRAIAQGEQAVQGAMRGVGAADDAARAARVGVESAEAALRPGAIARQVIPTRTDFANAFRGLAPSNLSSTFSGGLGQAQNWVAGVGAPFRGGVGVGELADLGARGADVVGAGVSGIQIYRVADNPFWSN